MSAEAPTSSRFRPGYRPLPHPPWLPLERALWLWVRIDWWTVEGMNSALRALAFAVRSTNFQFHPCPPSGEVDSGAMANPRTIEVRPFRQAAKDQAGVAGTAGPAAGHRQTCRRKAMEGRARLVGAAGLI